MLMNLYLMSEKLKQYLPINLSFQLVSTLLSLKTPIWDLLLLSKSQHNKLDRKKQKKELFKNLYLK